MNALEREPTPDELLAMAYADGELDVEARREFEERLRTSEELAVEVARHQKINVLARNSALPEPQDFEWERLAKDPLQRTGLGLGWVLVLFGSIGGAAWIGFGLFQSDMPVFLKLCLYALIVGFGSLFLAVLRRRLRTLPYDPYTEVQR